MRDLEKIGPQIAGHMESVLKFHQAADVAEYTRLEDVPPGVRHLRMKLMSEEFYELLDAEDADDIEEIADALADMFVVGAGTALMYGIPLDYVLREVNQSNLDKIVDGKVILRPDGKILKPEGWTKPDIETVLDLYGGEVPAEPNMADAIYAFVAWITTGPNRYVASGQDDSSVWAQLCGVFIEHQGWKAPAFKLTPPGRDVMPPSNVIEMSPPQFSKEVTNVLDPMFDPESDVEPLPDADGTLKSAEGIVSDTDLKEAHDRLLEAAKALKQDMLVHKADEATDDGYVGTAVSPTSWMDFCDAIDAAELLK